MKIYKALLIITIANTVLCAACATYKLSEDKLKQKAQKIHNSVLTIDTHTDTPLQLLNRGGYDMGEIHDPYKNGGKVDFVRMKNGGMDAMFFAVFTSQGIRDAENYQRMTALANQILDSIYLVVEKNKTLAEIALTPNDAYQLEKQGKRAIYIGIENGYPIAKDLSLVKKFYERGVRYITLCHSWNNDICDSSTDTIAEYNGLSKFGEQVVLEMNRLGMAIDVSHISDSSFYDVLNVSKAPVIASHSCARALCDNQRNLDDKMLKRLAEKNGVIQLCILSAYLKTPTPNPQRDSVMRPIRQRYKLYASMSDVEKEQFENEWDEANRKYPAQLATVSDAVDHIDHIVKLIGIDHVGIGTDFDGGGGLADCYDVSQIGNITYELVKRGYSQKDIEKIWGGNFMRVFSEVIKVAQNN